MKKLLLLVLCATRLAACGHKNEKSPEQMKIDSLDQANQRQEKELNDIMETMNRVNAGFNEIAEAEGRLTMGDSTQEQTFDKQTIDDNLNFIRERMQANRDLIAQLKDKLNAASISSEASSKLAENLRLQVADLESKYTAQVNRVTTLEAQLRAKEAEIQAKNQQIAGQNEQIAGQNEQIATQREQISTQQEQIAGQQEQISGQQKQISGLSGEVSNLNSQVSNLNSENQKKAEAMAAQDKELNTAWYVFGTNSELKAQNIINKGEVLRNGSFNKDYFTRIDIRRDRVIPFYSKNAQLLTSHPSGSYTLAKDAKGLYVLTINDPTAFWGISKYLVVKVK